MPFLPVSAGEISRPDFVYVCGDAYVDHPSFGAAIITRLLESLGFSVAVLAQPDYTSADDFTRFGKPRLGFMVSSGNLDSMVAHYTAAKKRRCYDYYSPGGKPGKRPDRAVIVYCNRIREAFGDVPIIIGGLEASLRRFAHYDYWDNRVRRSILADSRADLLSYGMGERSISEVARLLERGVPVKKIRGVRGTAYLCKREDVPENAVGGGEYDTLKSDKKAYAAAFAAQYNENDAIHGNIYAEFYNDKAVVCNPPAPPLERSELDRIYALPYMRTYHPSYEAQGGVPAIEEVRFSITHNRGCFGACAFCAIAYHQGRAVRSRSVQSCVREAEKIAAMPDFKGYIHDVGGPTANFRRPACDRQLTEGVCRNRRCLTPKPCPNLVADHSEYVQLLDAIAAVPGVKKVFIRSGIRYDYMLADRDDTFFRRLVSEHVSGQLKVAPEHISPDVLAVMGKPDVSVYDAFREKFFALSEECGKEQYLVPYLMSSHPGSTLSDAADLALYLRESGCNPEQVQDFYPTPGTASTVMFYTGLDPFTMKPVFVPSAPHEKAMQRALLQPFKPENRSLILEALNKCGRPELIPRLLPYRKPAAERKDEPSRKSDAAHRQTSSGGTRSQSDRQRGDTGSRQPRQDTSRQPKPQRKEGWAVAKAKTKPKAKTSGKPKNKPKL